MEKSSIICKPTLWKKENPITDNYMIWGYRNSLKAWQLWNMKKPHHIKGCEINFSVEMKYILVVLSHLCQKLVCWLISCLTKRKCRWKLRIVERPLDIFSASANCPLDTNFTFRTLRTGALECNWHTLSIIRHPTSHSAVAFISPVWHSDTDFTFSFRTDLLSAVDTNFTHYTSSQLHKESAVAFRSLLWQKLHIIIPNNSTHNAMDFTFPLQASFSHVITLIIFSCDKVPCVLYPS